MYAEPLNNFSSTELMHYTSHQTSTENVSTINPDYINNLDFNIYSQTSDINSDFLENELFNPLTQIGRHAQLVNQQENVTNYSDNITLNNHTDHLVENLNNIHYTNQDQSDFVTASPHGYSENNITTPLLEPYNGYSVQNTPLLPINQLLFSPVVNTSPAALSDFLFEDIVSTTCSDFGTPYTTTVPLITPNTPYINTPYVTSSPFSVASSTINTPFAFPLLDTPIGTNADPDLYDESTSKNSHWFSLFGSSNGFTKRPYEENNNFYSYQAINTMTSISPKNIETFEKKIDPSSPKSHHSEGSTPIPSDKTTSLAESPTPVIENSITISMSEAMVDNSKVIDNNTSGIMETIKSETINTHLSDSTPTTPVDSSKLVPIRPRPLDDDDTAENDSTRRSKRQRTMSVSEENEEDNDDETEKKYNCPECGRGFNRKFNMQTHRATHDPNRVKPFACEHPNCGSRFTRKHDLKRHINGIHKGEKVHECTVCRKPFSRKDAWKRHIATCGKM